MRFKSSNNMEVGTPSLLVRIGGGLLAAHLCMPIALMAQESGIYNDPAHREACAPARGLWWGCKAGYDEPVLDETVLISEVVSAEESQGKQESELSAKSGEPSAILKEPSAELKDSTPESRKPIAQHSQRSELLFFLQVGTFRELEYARVAAQRFRTNNCWLPTVTIDGESHFLVILGAFEDRQTGTTVVEHMLAQQPTLDVWLRSRASLEPVMLGSMNPNHWPTCQP